MLTVILFFICGIAIIVLSWRSGERKNLIDQTESDGRIFLLIILMGGIYFFFFSSALLYLKLYIFTTEYRFLTMGIYFLIPSIIGIASYCLIPRLCERHMNLTGGCVHGEIPSIAQLLDLESLPMVKYTDRKIPPFVYGRRGNTSVLVYPHHMDSFLSSEEKKAVLIHELSHIKQGDVGFFTWITLLLEGLKYWILFYPFIWIGVGMNFSLQTQVGEGSIMIPLLIIPLFLLKQSLSRTRESIADAYVVFHGLDTSLAHALFKYSALSTTIHTISSRLWFYIANKRFPSRLFQLIASHPPFEKRLNNIQTRALMKEESMNLSTPLAIWTGVTAAFLYNLLTTGIITILVITAYEIPDVVFDMAYVAIFCIVSSVTALSHIFPTTKSALYFSDLGTKSFLFPLLRNWVLTLGAAGVLFYCMTGNWSETQLLLSTMVGGVSLWIMGFASSRPTDFSTNTRYIIWGPLLWGCILLYPVFRTIRVFYDTGLISFYFLESFFGIILLLLLFSLLFMVEGYIRFSRPERIVSYFGKRWELVWMGDWYYVLVTVMIVFSIPSVLSFSIFVSVQWIAVMVDASLFHILLFGSAVPLVLYGIWKSEMLFFRYIAYLVHILSPHSIPRDAAEFIEKIIPRYASEDGGYDYAGLGFSNQEDTFSMLSTADILHIPVQAHFIEKWITSTVHDQGGFSLISGGLPRIEATFYAVSSLRVLKQRNLSPHHIQWMINHYTGISFLFPYDTCSELLQTCYAIICLSLIHQLPKNLKRCGIWIENQFSLFSTPREAYYVGKALKCLNYNLEIIEKWVVHHSSILSSRLDKNIIPIYYYVKTCEIVQHSIPPWIREQALKEIELIKEKYGTPDQ